ncbi:MAG: hypothetical protein FJ295_03215 [Planctomycetes bacterium]|nr:hypothetical protein [Planctomycetota bacterium]
MEVNYHCPECSAVNNAAVREGGLAPLSCVNCDAQLVPPSDAILDGRVVHCLVCPSTELYVRKDFSQRTGVAIVVVGLGASCIGWFYRHFQVTYAILFATALLDAGLYLLRGSLLQCYRCQAEYRGLADLQGGEPFRLETHEKYRQQAARLAEGRPASQR